jgi:hypothetical protein
MLPGGLGNVVLTKEEQQYKQAVNQFAQAILRKESGAAITPTEYTMTDTTYFPQPGDDKAVIAQKRQAREQLIETLKRESLPAQTRLQTPGGQQGAGGGGTSPYAHIPANQLTAEQAAAEEQWLMQQMRR